MPLNTGKWKIDANGFVGDLNITSVDGTGNLTGNVLIDAPRVDQINGFWDEASQRIMFQRIINPADPSSIQTYTGFMFQDPLRMQGVSGDTAFTLAGYFEAFSVGGGSSQRPLYGWYAQIGVSRCPGPRPVICDGPRPGCTGGEPACPGPRPAICDGPRPSRCIGPRPTIVEPDIKPRE